MLFIDKSFLILGAAGQDGTLMRKALKNSKIVNLSSKYLLSSGNTIIKDSNDKTITTKDIENIDQTGGTSYFIVQQIEVVNAPMKPTKKVNIILAELGELGDKKFVSLMTIFPGEGAADLMNKQDYIKAGYVFVTGKQPVAESIYHGAHLYETTRNKTNI